MCAMSDAGRNPWRVLGVAEDAPFSDVKRAYLRLARATHPDAPGGSAGAFREVQAAFEALRRRAAAQHATAPAAPPAPAATGRPAPPPATPAAASSDQPAPGPATPPGAGRPAAGPGDRPAPATPYDRWLAGARPSRPWSRQWSEQDPLVARRPAASTRRRSFAETLAGELAGRSVPAA